MSTKRDSGYGIFLIGAPQRLMLAVALLVQIGLKGARGQLGEIPPCDVDTAQLCFDNGIQSTQPSGCNWYRIIPPMYACVDDATAGCTFEEQTDWYNLVYAYNTSLQSDDCYPGCTGQGRREQMMFACFDVYGLSDLAATISNDPSIGPTSGSCATLIRMDTCLRNATGGCPALTDVSYDRINSTRGAQVAYAQCGITAFQPATTSAPLNILNTIPSQTPTPGPTKDTTVNGTDLAIIILGSVLIVATILVILVAICLAVRRRREVRRRSIFYDWQPNGQKVYRDEPQWVKQERVNFRGASEGGRAYRPLGIIREDGGRPTIREAYVNEGAVVYH